MHPFGKHARPFCDWRREPKNHGATTRLQTQLRGDLRCPDGRQRQCGREGACSCGSAGSTPLAKRTLAIWKFVPLTFCALARNASRWTHRFQEILAAYVPWDGDVRQHAHSGLGWQVVEVVPECNPPLRLCLDTRMPAPPWQAERSGRLPLAALPSRTEGALSSGVSAAYSAWNMRTTPGV